jgi:hypothetical protein
MKITKKLHLILFPLSLLLLFAFWFPTRNLPYWWDSAGLIIQGAEVIFKHNLTIFDPDLPLVYGHSPLFPYLVAVSWKLFGQSLLTSHLINLLFAALLVVYTYLLSRQIVKDPVKGNIVAFLASTLLLFTPVYYAQLGIVYLEIPATVMALAAVYYFFKKNYIALVVVSTLLLYFKEVDGFVLLVLLGYFWVKESLVATQMNKKIDKKNMIRKTVLFLIPFALVMIWFVYRKIHTGGFLVPANFVGAGPQVITPEQIGMVFKFVFFDQWRVLVTLLSLFLIEETLVKHQFHSFVLKGEVVVITIIPIITAFYFGLLEFLSRYIIVGLPFLYISFAYLLVIYLHTWNFKKQAVAIASVMLVLSIAFYSQWNLHRHITTWYYPPLEDNLEYQDVIAVGQAVSQYLEKHFPDSKIITSFPSTYMFAEPYQGYVKKPLISKACARLKKNEMPDIIVFHPFSPVSQNCLYDITLFNFKPYRNFEKNGKFMSIYMK